jgi:hypothetical protein
MNMGTIKISISTTENLLMLKVSHTFKLVNYVLYYTSTTDRLHFNCLIINK